MTTRHGRILVVSADESVLADVIATLSARGYQDLHGVADPAETLAQYRELRPSLIVLDAELSRPDAFEVMEALAEVESAYLPVIMLVDREDRRQRLRALASPAKDIVSRSLDQGELGVRVENLLEVRMVYTQLAAKEHALEAVLDCTGEAIAMFDNRERLVFMNRQYADLSGVDSPTGVDAGSVRERMKTSFQEPDAFERRDAAMFADGGATATEILEMREPRHRLLQRIGSPVIDRAGASLGRIVVYRDVSKEAEIERMKEEVLHLRADAAGDSGFADLLGNSRAMREMFYLMRRALDHDISVLIRGESGAGKELVARAIHYNSRRSDGPFVVVNCAAIPDTLIESQFFGHERGAFTDAIDRRIGAFEQADGGALFLDEVGELSMVAQAKLLRAIQEREIRRIGGTSPIPVDIRVISATHRNLWGAVEAGEFREDLYYRIAVYPIATPPLRERRDDIPLLAQHALSTFSQELGSGVDEISVDALARMMDYDWPGNVRELHNVIQRAIVLTKGSVLGVESLPQPLIAATALSVAPSHQSDGAGIATLADAERQTIQRALALAEGNIVAAARMLNLHRSSLYRKMERHDIDTGRRDTSRPA